MRVLSIQVGLPQNLPAAKASGKPWRSAIVKQVVSGPVALGLEGLAGDGQADRRFHGGPERALMAYASEHYPLWREELGRESLPAGSFGENLTLEGLTEAQASIGDVLAL